MSIQCPTFTRVLRLQRVALSRGSIHAGEVQDIDGHDDNRKDWIVAQSPCGHEKAPVVR